MNETYLQFPVADLQENAFLAQPDGAGPYPAVVVTQEWWGLNENIKSIARRYAEAGYVALAPDLYHGKIVSEPNEAQKAAMELDRPRAVAEIVAAAVYLKALHYVAPKAIGVVGYCMGGGLALAATVASTDFGAAVAYYGGGAPGADAFAHNHAAILNILGEKDERVTNAITQTDAELTKQAVTFPHEVVIYPGAQHAFFNDSRPEVHDAGAAADSFMRAIAWFNKYLV